MNQYVKENIIFACHKYKNIAISINVFVDLLREYEDILEPVTDRAILASGLYASLFGSSIYVTRYVKPFYMMVSNTQQESAFNEKKWSENIPLNVAPDVFKKYEKMKVFW